VSVDGGPAALRRRAVVRGIALVVVAVLTVFQVGVASAASITIANGRLTTVTRTYGAAQTCTLTAISDSYVNKALATTNFGTGTTLLVNADSTTTERAIVRFDLSSCSPAIPSDALVQTANLQLTIAVAALATRTYALRRATASWAESTVTWNLQPAVASATASTTISLGSLTGTVVEWTATSDVQAYVTGSATDLGWRVSDSNEGIVLGTPLTVGSREAATGQPKLVVTYLP
jgi:hypothetical protein